MEGFVPTPGEPFWVVSYGGKFWVKKIRIYECLGEKSALDGREGSDWGGVDSTMSCTKNSKT